ncbi:MAG: TlpA family protein disulfide reductase [Planctomycetota bacterium]|nr:MAG: TlpA family protein disulfide reductase [Planctomycetota bacterium]
MPSSLIYAVIASLATTGLVGLSPEPGTQPVEVDATAYATADWPAHNRGRLYAKDMQGKELPVKLGNETWLTEEKDLSGKVLVLDFWATWCGPCIAASPKLEKLQKDHKGNLEVVAISGQGEDEQTVRSWLEKKGDKIGYNHVFDAEQRVYKPLGITGIPHVVVLSTDGVIRWQGNPHEKDFAKIVSQIVSNDPLIKAKNAG